MTRNSTKDLFTPFEDPEREFRSTRKLFKTPSLDDSSSPEFDLFYDLEEQSEGEAAETMEPTIEEYICKTREDYGLGVDMQEVILFYKGLDVPTRQILDSKGTIPTMKAADAKKAIQEMADHSKKWHNKTSTRARITETSNGLAAIQPQLNNLGREIKKVNEKVYVAQVRCESCGGPYYSKDCPLKEEAKAFEEGYYTQFGVPFPQGGRYIAAALRFYQRDSGNPSYQERRQIMEESLSKFMAESAKRHDKKI
ncbi:hypothetical protein Tco_0684720 [Tanacetum coccineum]